MSIASCTSLRGARKKTPDGGEIDAAVGARDAGSKMEAGTKLDGGSTRGIDAASPRVDSGARDSGAGVDAARMTDGAVHPKSDGAVAVDAGADACGGSVCPASDPCSSNPCGVHASCAQAAQAPG